MATTDHQLDVRTLPPLAHLGVSAQTDVHFDAVSDDSRRGLAMFLIFSSAVLIVTAAVALVALVGTWWVLGLVFALHVLMTTAVVVTIAVVLNDRSSTGVRAHQA